MVVSHIFHLNLHCSIHHSPHPPPPPRPQKAGSTRANPCSSQSPHDTLIRHDLRRNSLLSGRRNSRHQMVLAEVQDPIWMAPLFPTGNSSLRPCILLVIHLLPLSVPPNFQHVFQYSKKSYTLLCSPFQPLHSNMHVISLARVFSILSSFGNSLDDPSFCGGIRV